MSAMLAIKFSCDKLTPLGTPVLPDENCKNATSLWFLVAVVASGSENISVVLKSASGESSVSLATKSSIEGSSDIKNGLLRPVKT